MVNCPPGCRPWYSMGFSPAREAYMAAVYPAGPDPIIRQCTFSFVVVDSLIAIVLNTSGNLYMSDIYQIKNLFGG
jgi:hypothetical protein